MAKKEAQRAIERGNMKVFGKVSFYGKVDTYDKKGKEYALTLEDWEIKDFDEDIVNGWYTDDKGKVNLPKQADELVDFYNGKGEKPEKLYFRSQYPIDNVNILEDGEVKNVELDYAPDFNEVRICMSFYRSYIGSVAVGELPPEYKRVAFDASEFEGL
jgi:hypothetical protein